MIYKAITDIKRLNNLHGGQKDILNHFNISYTPRTSTYIINNEYIITFIKSKDKSGWKNHLTSEGFLYESNVSNNPNKLKMCNTRLCKRITFFKNMNSKYDGYSFIGIFILDQTYDYTKDKYPTGLPMNPRLKYIRIENNIDTNLFKIK